MKDKMEADRAKMEEEFNEKVAAHAAKEVERVERDLARRYKVSFERERRQLEENLGQQLKLQMDKMK